MWFKVRAADATFTDASKKRFTYDFRVDMTPDEVFRIVTAPSEIGRWMPDVRGARWVTGEPHGVGSLREVRLSTIAVHAKVLLWEPGERFAFTIVRASAPILKRMVEDFRFEPIGLPVGARALGTGLGPSPATRVRWTISYQPKALAMPLEPLLAPRFAKMFEAASRRLTQLDGGAA